ncbi:MAG: toprim domain-containing protein [Leptospirales bacterium]
MNTKKAAPPDGPSNTTEDILSRLQGVRKSGQGWTARCPAHEDRNQSLSLRITETGRLLAHCFAGCSFDEIREALGLTGERFSPSHRTIEEGPTPEQVEAQAKAVRIWKGAKPAREDHPYIVRKKILPHQARQFKEILLIPLQDSSGTLWNLQFIHTDGAKRFLRGGMTKGLFTLIGEPSEAGRLYLAEGFATAATVHELTGRPVFVAFSASNLPAVAQVVRRAFPGAEIVLAADADPAGERYSEEAARSIDGLICYAGRA